ncbi:transcriptional regulator [Alphaproteobacteria bacterium 46_93_T64]|nr:transcriptional regulator [Alphaproteobacteria bacterium 46_93_T64]
MKRHDIPSLDDLRAFETVARAGSVRAAAEELALTHGAVSRRIIKLAHDIDIVLFERDGRGIKLTIEGEKLAQTTTEAFALLSKTLSDIKSVPDNVPITLSCERSVAMHWLIPRLSVFQDAHPEIEVHLSVGGGTFDFVKDRIGLAIRRLDFALDPDWLVEPLMEESMGPVMQPDMIARFHSGDYVALASKTRPNAWKKWIEAHGGSHPPKEIRFLDHHFLMVEGAANGLGVAMCPKVLAFDDLTRGRLIAPFGFDYDSTHYGIIHPNNTPASDQLTLIKNWLFEIAKELK